MSAGPLWCVVPAAGRGTRVGGECPKQYLPLAGQPLILHTLQRLASHPQVAGLLVVLDHADTRWPGWTSLCGKPVVTTSGGAARCDSVRAGLAALPRSVTDEDFVLVHDAARPCVRALDVTRLIDLGSLAGGGLLAAPVRDTLKLADEHGRSKQTEPRERYWRALTPQLFRRGQLAAALAAAAKDAISVSDEAMAMERTGYTPLLVEGAEDNLKVTTRADFALAEFLLARTA
ncbi:MAG: 2-C-methyl-D-erythritol 4-phosphate cytidylyltransferase [Rhodanobacter sp.]